jgi:ribonucleoside-diphosphate reductase alpha chain
VDKPLQKDNVESMIEVIKLHRDAVENIQASVEFAYLKDQARRTWEVALAQGRKHGYRNAQVTVLAPTGTIAFLMDCDTTGVEPDIALVKYKLLAGGGMLKIVNRGVPDALRRLGYAQAEIDKIVAHVEKYDTIEDVAEDTAPANAGIPNASANERYGGQVWIEARMICPSSTAHSGPSWPRSIGYGASYDDGRRGLSFPAPFPNG